MKIKLLKNYTQTNCTTESKIHIDQILRRWDISIYVWLLVGNKSIWSGYDLEKNSRWFVVRTFILEASIIDDWLVAWLGYFHQWVRFIF